MAAKEGSIRSTLAGRTQELGLQAITSSWNGVHLSAGPVEALVELIRYSSDFESGETCSIADFSFGKSLQENFPKETIDKILANATVSYKGKQTSVFDLTEEKNAHEALELLKDVFEKLTSPPRQ
ncbi:MAG: hypothetical protein HC896_13935 [Bacteroidales bacterium]|nr:hypothetical protein [Bacteroidales bacterium]